MVVITKKKGKKKERNLIWSTYTLSANFHKNYKIKTNAISLHFPFINVFIFNL